MGHDITAIKDYTEYKKFWENVAIGEDTEDIRKKNEIAYLRRSMGSKTIIELYKSLGFEKVYAGCSGDGSFVIVDIDTLKEAKKEIENSISDNEDKEDYLKFLNDCITYCKNEDKRAVIIHFG